MRYYAYGKTRYTTTAATPTTFRFTGQRWQKDANDLYFYQSRWYDPLVGRFLSADTIVQDPKNPQALNRYTYVGNSPLRYVDPSGHAEEPSAQTSADLFAYWIMLAEQDPSRLDAELLAWMMEHQNIRDIAAMGAFLEHHFGGSAAAIPSAYNTIYATAFTGGSLPELSGIDVAVLAAESFLSFVGIGDVGPGSYKREMAGRPTGFGGGLLTPDERIVIFEGRPGSGEMKTYDKEGLSAQNLTVAGTPEQAHQAAFGRPPAAGDPYWQTTAGQIEATGRFAYLDGEGSPGHVSIYGGARDSNPSPFSKIWTRMLFGP